MSVPPVRTTTGQCPPAVPRPAPARCAIALTMAAMSPAPTMLSPTQPAVKTGAHIHLLRRPSSPLHGITFLIGNRPQQPVILGHVHHVWHSTSKISMQRDICSTPHFYLQPLVAWQCHTWARICLQATIRDPPEGYRHRVPTPVCSKAPKKKVPVRWSILFWIVRLIAQQCLPSWVNASLPLSFAGACAETSRALCAPQQRTICPATTTTLYPHAAI